MKRENERKIKIVWPWQATMAIYIFLLAFLPGIVGFTAFGSSGSNDDDATVAALSVQAVSIIVVAATWWAESKWKYLADFLATKHKTP